MTKIYCAGPLFNDPERAEMARIAGVLEAAGYATFLPHRDGLEFARLLPRLGELGLAPAQANAALQRAIFSLDVYQLITACDGVVANLNGRVADEGTVVEASLAWRSGKALVLYKDDARSLIDGTDNPMVMGLGEFETVDSIDKIAPALGRARTRALTASSASAVERVLAAGARIAQARDASREEDGAALAVAALFHPGFDARGPGLP